MTISYVMPLITTEMGEIHFNSTISPWINETGMENTTDYPPSNEKHVTMEEQWLITFCYLFGIVGNVSALVILAKNETLRNKKQTLMMRCLAWNDLIALVGSFVLMYLKLYSTIDETHARLLCAIRVFWRTFGLGSGSVAVVMAVERFLALTKPFVYQKVSSFTHSIFMKFVQILQNVEMKSLFRVKVWLFFFLED